MRSAWLLAAVLTGCTSINADQEIFLRHDAAAVDAPPLEPTFDSLYANIFGPRCAEICHGGGINAAGNMDLGSADPYAVLVEIPAAGTQCGDGTRIRVVPGDAEGSLLYQKVLAKQQGTAAPCGDPMPQGPDQPALSAAQVDTIRQWIAAGANR